MNDRAMVRAGSQRSPWRPRGSWVYVLASVPLALFAVVGWEYGAFWLYFVPALICIAQFLRPTKPVWLFLVGLYLVGSAMYLVLLGQDLVRLVTAEPKVLVDCDDALAVVALVVMLVGVTYGLLRVRPHRS